MTTFFDNILSHLNDSAIEFIGKVKNDVFTPSSFKFTSENESQENSATVDPVEIGQFAAVGASGIGLFASAGVITIAKNIQSRLAEIENKLGAALFRLEIVDKKIDKLLSITKRIDIKVAESHLRESMKHLMRTSINEDGVDMDCLAQIGDDIDSMLESIDGGLLGNPSVKLSTDVRSLLESIYRLFFASRCAFSTAYNHRHSAEGVPLLPIDGLDDLYLLQDLTSAAQSVVRLNKLFLQFEALNEQCQQFVATRFTFSDDEDKNDMREMLNSFVQENSELFASPADIQMQAVLPEELFAGDLDEQIETVRSYLEAWIWKTDAGLLRRIQLELFVFRGGYEGFLNEKIQRDKESKNLVIKAPFKLAA